MWPLCGGHLGRQVSALKGKHGEGECSCRRSEKYTTRDGGRDGVKKEKKREREKEKKKKKREKKENTTVF